MVKRIILCSMLAALCGSPPVFAWGQQGHQTVGAIADLLLRGTHAGTRVKTILGSDGTLQTAALWADCAKGTMEKPPYRYVVNSRYPECAPFQSAAGQRAMVAYVKRNLTACHPTAAQESCHRQYHYADVAIERDAYAKGDVGTSDHDIVSAIGAAVTVLEGGTAPAPFSIKTKKEALRLLAHWVGDVHQPLHVGAVYLDAHGRLLDPDREGLVPDSATAGGNLIKDGSSGLHGEWDTIPAAFEAPAFAGEGVTLAHAIPRTAGAVDTWPATWASETVTASHQAFQGLAFGAEVNPGTKTRNWPVTEPADYVAQRAALQKDQLVKAGARLAQILEGIWPE
jgi:hypothetical protein